MGAAWSNETFDADFRGITSSLMLREKKRLYRRFMRLSKGQKYIERQTLLDIPEISTNPLKDRVTMQFIDMNRDRISLKSFIENIEVFSGTTSLEKKATFIFNVYDVDRNAIIDEADMTHILTSVLGVADNSDGKGPSLASLKSIARNTIDGMFAIIEKDPEEFERRIDLRTFTLLLDRMEGASLKLTLSM